MDYRCRFIPGLLLCMAAVSCAPSKEDAAVARVMNRKPAASVRLINFTSKPLAMKLDAGVASASADFGHNSAYFTIKAGDHQFYAVDGTNPVAELPVKLDPGGSQSVIALSSGGKVVLEQVSGEIRKKEPGKINAVVRLAQQSGLSAASLRSGASTANLSPGQLVPLPMVVGDNDLELRAGSLSVKSKLSAKDGHSYTIHIFKGEKGLEIVPIQNTPSDPGISGSAAGA
jgi:hypothetical protein